jgi:flavin reductase (DIM6/NTAB) family NADH-FMN oxidoreductase RutF
MSFTSPTEPTVSTTSASTSPLVEIPLRPRFFQASAYFPMPVVILATRAEDGGVNLAPYSLCFPVVGDDGHRLMLVTRSASKTARNILRSGRVSINFLPDSPAFVAQCRALAAPVASAEKLAASGLSWHPSPRPDAADGTKAPPLVDGAVQVFECTLISQQTAADGEEHRFVLEVEAIRMPAEWAEILERGGRGPHLPVDYGFRRGSESWHSRPQVASFGPRLRPKFEVRLERPPERVLADFKAGLARPDVALTAKIRGEAMQIGLPEAELHTWSPSLDLRVEPDEGGGTVVRGRIGPQPQVWTTFMFFHMLIAMVGIGGLMWGLAASLAGESAWPAWLGLVAVFLHAFVAGAAFIGQGLGADQIHRLRSFVDDTLL